MLEIALKIDLLSLPFGRSRESNHPKYPRAYPLSDPFDDPSFPGCVSALKENNDPRSGMLHPELQFDQLRMELSDLLFVFFTFELPFSIRFFPLTVFSPVKFAILVTPHTNASSAICRAT